MIWAIVISALAAWPPAEAPAASQANVNTLWDSVQWELLRSADTFWHGGKYERMMRTGFIWMEADPGNLNAYSDTAFILESGLLMYADAEKVHRRAVKALPNDWKAWHDLVFFLYQWRKDYKQAAKVGEHMLTLSPMPTAYHLVANCYDKAGDLEKSLATWQRGIDKDPSDATAKRRYSEVSQLIQERKKGTN